MSNPEIPNDGDLSPDAQLEDNKQRYFIKTIVAVFAYAGTGHFLGMMMFFEILGEEDFSIQYPRVALTSLILATPIISIVTGFMTALRFKNDDRTAVLTSMVGAGIGFIFVYFIGPIIEVIFLESPGVVQQWGLPLFGFIVPSIVVAGLTTNLIEQSKL